MYRLVRSCIAAAGCAALFTVSCAPATPRSGEASARDAQLTTHVYAMRAGFVAFETKQYSEAASAFERAFAANPGDDVATYLAALAHARAGETAPALAWLDRLARSGSDLVPAAGSFGSLASRPELSRAVEATRAAASREHTSTEAARIDETGLLPEGVAYDPRGHAFYVGSIRTRKIVKLAPGEGALDFVPASADIDAVLGLRVDPERRTLWAATEADEDQDGYAPADRGRSALLAIDLVTAAVRRFVLPRDRPHLLNDVALGSDGTPYVTDSRAGLIWTLPHGQEALQALSLDAQLVYPNGITYDDAGHLFVADAVGVWRCDPASGHARALRFPRGVSLAGFDGLYFTRGALVGVQNSVGPGRVVELPLDEAREAVVTRRILEADHPAFDVPTTAAVVDDALYVLADSQTRSPNAPAPVVLLRTPL